MRFINPDPAVGIPGSSINERETENILQVAMNYIKAFTSRDLTS